MNGVEVIMKEILVSALYRNDKKGEHRPSDHHNDVGHHDG